MKKVLLFIPNLGSGGAERQIVWLAKVLTEAKYDVKLITYIDKNFYYQFCKDNKIVHELRPELRSKYFRPLRLARIVNSWKPDVLISYLPSCNMAVCLARFFCKTKVVVSERSSTLEIGFREKLLYNLYRLADYVVPNSNFQSEILRKEFPFMKGKIRTITNFIDTDLYIPSVNDSKQERIVTLARLMRGKNCIRYIEAIKKIKEKKYNIHFDWYGDLLTPGYDEEINKAIKESDVADYITFHKATSKPIKEYQNAIAICLPTLYEGFPNVVCEAMSCGLPILSSRVCEIPNIVKEGENGFLFNPLDVDDIVVSIERFLTLNNDERMQMSKSSRKIALEKFSKKTFTKSYIEIIEN